MKEWAVTFEGSHEDDGVAMFVNVEIKVEAEGEEEAVAKAVIRLDTVGNKHFADAELEITRTQEES